jgi:UDP-N-acetylmuramoyl-tripeptide--D-alanyl-D-alanine ligase
VVHALIHGREVQFPIGQTGAHWGPNSLCVLLLLEALDVDLETGLKALAACAPLEGRGVERTIVGPKGAFVLIDESYNANPLSMRAAIKTLGAHSCEGLRIAVLTDMLELGPDEVGLHAALTEPLKAAKVDLVFCAGPLMWSLWEALAPDMRGGYAPGAAELVAQIAEAVGAGDVLMVKGSNGSRARLIAAALARLDEEATGDIRGAA